MPERTAAPRFDSTLDTIARNASPIGFQSAATTQDAGRSVVMVTRADTMSILWDSPPGRSNEARDPVRQDYDKKRGRLSNATGRNSTNDGSFKAASRDATLKNRSARAARLAFKSARLMTLFGVLGRPAKVAVEGNATKRNWYSD